MIFENDALAYVKPCFLKVRAYQRGVQDESGSSKMVPGEVLFFGTFWQVRKLEKNLFGVILKNVNPCGICGRSWKSVVQRSMFLHTCFSWIFMLQGRLWASRMISKSTLVRHLRFSKSRLFRHLRFRRIIWYLECPGPFWSPNIDKTPVQKLVVLMKIVMPNKFSISWKKWSKNAAGGVHLGGAKVHSAP